MQYYNIKSSFNCLSFNSSEVLSINWHLSVSHHWDVMEKLHIT